MSSHEQNPHAKREEPPEVNEPYPFRCRGCDKRHVTTHENTRFVRHERTPWFDHVEIDCDNKDSYATIRFTSDGESREWAEQFKTRERIYGSDQIRELFKQTNKIEDVKEYELTPGHETRLDHFREILENAPPGFVVAELADLPMPPKKLNNYWPEQGE